jgi:hypothetical protein
MGGCPDYLLFFEGKYGDLLSLNLVGSVVCFALFLLPKLFGKEQTQH